MRVIFFTSLDYTAKIANCQQTRAMAFAFQKKLGNNFTLIIDNVFQPDLLEGLNLIEIKSPIKKFRTFYNFFWFLLNAEKLLSKKESNVLYFKDPNLCLLAIFARPIFGYKVVFEYHLMYKNFRDKIICRGSDYVVAITSHLKKEIINRGFPADKILVEPDAVDLDIFDIKTEKEAAREKLGLAKDKTILLYTGRFKTMGMDKGISDILKALAALKNRNLLFVAVGGLPKDKEFYQGLAEELGVGEQVNLITYCEQKELAIYQKAADFLLMPFPFNEHFAYYMSPLKLFEYMAARRPIIASDLPSIRDVLSDETCYFCQPGDPKDLAEVINKAIKNPAESRSKAANAYKQGQKHSWIKRAEQVISFIDSHIGG